MGVMDETTETGEPASFSVKVTALLRSRALKGSGVLAGVARAEVTCQGRRQQRAAFESSVTMKSNRNSVLRGV